jgi:uncharacterized Zn finger protein (UPF0148 family)
MRRSNWLVGAALMALGAVVAARQSAPIPPGPSVPVSDGWYHDPACSIARGRQAPSMPLADALRQKLTACPICEPLKSNPEWAAYVATWAQPIAEEVRAKEAAVAAEVKRRIAEAEAERTRHLEELEAERKRLESAPVTRITEAQARAFAASAAQAASGDPAAFQSAFRSAVRAVAPDYVGPQIVFASGTLRITLSGPVGTFETTAVDRIRRGQAIATIPWVPEATVSVTPTQADAPDIQQVVVQRSDASRPVGAETLVTAMSSTLASRRLPGAPPSSPAVSWGEVVFPLTAFEPGPSVFVRVIVVPRGAANLSKTFSAVALRGVQ